MRVVLDIIIVLVIVSIGGFFASAEIALVSLREGQVRSLARRGRRGTTASLTKVRTGSGARLQKAPARQPRGAAVTWTSVTIMWNVALWVVADFSFDSKVSK